MNPYRNIPGSDALKRLPSLLRKRTLLAFALGLTAGVGLGPAAAVMALRSATPSVPVEAPTAIAAPVERVDPPDPPAAVADPPPPEHPRMTSEQARATIAGQADRVMGALKARDTRTLAAMIDEDEGLVLNPFSQSGDFPAIDAGAVRGCFQDHRLRVWGDRGGSGATVTLTCADYWKRFIGFADLGAPSEVTYNELHATELDQESQLGVDADDIFVRYFFVDKEESSVIQIVTLVFTPTGRAWKLSEITHQGQAAGEPCGG